MVDVILDRAGQKGTGKWSAIEAQTARRSSHHDRGGGGRKGAVVTEGGAPGGGGRLRQGRIERLPAGPGTLPQLELALFAGKIAAYAQGFAVMEAASKEFGWNLPMPTIARIWRAGCIIRSQFLGTLAEALSGAGAANLLMTPAFVTMMQEAHPSLRLVVARAAEAGLPTPALVPRSPISTATGRDAARPTSSRRSAISSARTASSASTDRAPSTGHGEAALPADQGFGTAAPMQGAGHEMASRRKSL